MYSSNGITVEVGQSVVYVSRISGVIMRSGAVLKVSNRRAQVYDQGLGIKLSIKPERLWVLPPGPEQAPPVNEFAVGTVHQRYVLPPGTRFRGVSGSGTGYYCGSRWVVEDLNQYALGYTHSNQRNKYGCGTDLVEVIA
jgi:hypothetical protein